MSDEIELYSSPEGSPEGKIVRRKNLIPSKITELDAVGRECLLHWRESQIDIKWTNPDTFEEKLNELLLNSSNRTQNGIDRNPITRRLKELDRLIESHLRYIKDYIAEYYSSSEFSATNFYKDFGIIKHVNGGFIIPRSRDERIKSLKVLISAIESHGFNDKKFGKTFWQDILTEYSGLFEQSYSSDSTVKSDINLRNKLKSEVRKTLKAISRMLQAVYPDNYTDMYRVWGFQKEKY